MTRVMSVRRSGYRGADMSIDWLISVDDHIVEASDLWMNRLPAKYADVGPRVMRMDDGNDMWAYEDARWGVPGVGAVMGKPKDDWTLAPANYDELHPSCYDPVERIKTMDVAGILAQSNF